VERLLRPKEVCQLLGISYSTLLRWIREGKIRAVTTEGGKYRIPYSEIKKYLERMEKCQQILRSTSIMTILRACTRISPQVILFTYYIFNCKNYLIY